jgi:Ca2+-transporting ATPase
MRIPPIPGGEPLLNGAVLSRVALMTPVMGLSTLGYFIWRLSQGVDYAQVQTETFTVLAACQWFNVLNCRSATHSAFDAGLMRNRWLLGGLTLGIILQMTVIYWPPMNQLFHTVPLAAGDFLLMALAASSVLWVEELRKLVVRRRRR